MKITALKKLTELDFKVKQNLYKNVPNYSIPKTRFYDSTTAGLTQSIITLFKLHGFFVTRLDSKGTWSQKLLRFIPSHQKHGLPDIQAIGKDGRAIFIEVKCAATKDKLKPHQKEVHEQLTKTGALVVIAKDFESFYEWFTSEILNTATHG